MAFLTITLYVLGIALLVVLIILGIKLIYVIDGVTDAMSYLSDTVVDAVVSGLSRIFPKRKKTIKKEEELENE